MAFDMIILLHSVSEFAKNIIALENVTNKWQNTIAFMHHNKLVMVWYIYTEKQIF